MAYGNFIFKIAYSLIINKRPRHTDVARSSSCSVLDNDGRVCRAVFEDQVEQGPGVVTVQTDAALGVHLAQTVDFVGAVGGDVPVEENGVRHRRVVVLARIVVGIHRLNTERAGRGPAVFGPGRNRPFIGRHTIDQYDHALVSLVDNGRDRSGHSREAVQDEQNARQHQSPHGCLL